MTPDTSASKPQKSLDRPFPWPCGNCLQNEVYPETMPYVLDVKHDGQLYHLEIPALSIPRCRACGELVFSNHVDEQVSQALRAHVVAVSLANLERSADHAEMMEFVRESGEDIEAGRTEPAVEALERLAKKHKLHRKGS